MQGQVYKPAVPPCFMGLLPYTYAECQHIPHQ